MTDLSNEQALKQDEEREQPHQAKRGKEAALQPIKKGDDPSPLGDSESLPTSKKQSAAHHDHLPAWQTTLWREWCRSKDEMYAHHLFDLVKDTTLGRPFVVVIALLGLIGGAIPGYLLGSWVTIDINLQIGVWNLTGLPPLILTWVLGVAGGLLGIETSRSFRSWYYWWQGQPSATRVERALQQAVIHHPKAADIWDEPLRTLQRQREQPNDPDQLILMLESTAWIDRFVARKTLVSIGGQATKALQEVAVDKSMPLWETAIWLLTSIERETANRFAWRTHYVICPNCLTCFGKHSVDVPKTINFTYYGCRVCAQSRAYFYAPEGIVAVLDSEWTGERVHQEGILRINWLFYRTLFDFDWVEIIQATDEDVERFAVQVGNDTDPFRQPRYRQMHCFVALTSGLSANSVRILHRTFGQVQEGKVDQ